MSAQNSRDQVIALLASGLTQAQVATEARISAKTVSRWQKEPSFASEVAAVRSQYLDRTLGFLSAATVHAAITLAALLDECHADSVRLGAARTLLEMHARLKETAELEARVAALEAQELSE
jgi:hypothetical protein